MLKTKLLLEGNAVMNSSDGYGEYGDLPSCLYNRMSKEASKELQDR